MRLRLKQIGKRMTLTPEDKFLDLETPSEIRRSGAIIHAVRDPQPKATLEGLSEIRKKFFGTDDPMEMLLR